MKRTDSKLPVIYANIALDELDEIAAWNEHKYSSAQASSYIAFLRGEIEAISIGHWIGRPLEGSRDFRYVQVGRQSQSHGHVVVYKIRAEAVQVLHIFHTAQDWQPLIGNEED